MYISWYHLVILPTSFPRSFQAGFWCVLQFRQASLSFLNMLSLPKNSIFTFQRAAKASMIILRSAQPLALVKNSALFFSLFGFICQIFLLSLKLAAESSKIISHNILEHLVFIRFLCHVTLFYTVKLSLLQHTWCVSLFTSESSQGSWISKVENTFLPYLLTIMWTNY